MMVVIIKCGHWVFKNLASSWNRIKSKEIGTDRVREKSMAAAATASVVPANRGGRRNGAVDDEKLVFETTEGVEPIMSFDQMGIKDDLLRGIYAYGFEKPSAIQQRAVLPIIQGRDVIAQAQSGTGKTSMIALTVCQMVDTSNREYVVSPCLDILFLVF